MNSFIRTGRQSLGLYVRLWQLNKIIVNAYAAIVGPNSTTILASLQIYRMPTPSPDLSYPLRPSRRGQQRTGIVPLCVGNLMTFLALITPVTRALTVTERDCRESFVKRSLHQRFTNIFRGLGCRTSGLRPASGQPTPRGQQQAGAEARIGTGVPPREEGRIVAINCLV